MLKFVDITEENSEQFSGIIPAQYLSDIPREYFRGLAGEDCDTKEIGATIIWEIHNADQEKVDNQVEILWFSALNEENGANLLKTFDSWIGEDDVRSVYFEIESLRDHEIAALEKAGFEARMTEGIDLYVPVKEIGRSGIAKKKADKYVISLSELSSFQFKAGIMNSVYNGRYGLLDDLPFLPMNRYDGELSCCVMTDDRVTGLLLVHLMKPSLYRVELLFSEKLDASVNMLNMLRFSARAAQKICEPTDEVLIRRHNRTVMEICKKLFPGEKGKNVIRGIRK